MDSPGVPEPAPPPAAQRTHPAEAYCDPTTRLRGAQVAVSAAMVMVLVGVVVELLLFLTLYTALQETPEARHADLTELPLTLATVDRINQMDLLSALGGVVQFIALIAAAVFVLRWQAVAVRNQGALGMHPRYGPVKATLSWLVPIWWLFGPKQAYNDLWRSGALRGDSLTAVPGRMAVWWGLWLLGFLSASAGNRLYLYATTLGEELESSVLYMISGVAVLGAGMLFRPLLRDISARQNRRAAEKGLVEATSG